MDFKYIYIEESMVEKLILKYNRKQYGIIFHLALFRYDWALKIYAILYIAFTLNNFLTKWSKLNKMKANQGFLNHAKPTSSRHTELNRQGIDTVWL